MKRLIVNADDFGVTSSVNQGIIFCFQKGIVTSTSLMVNRPAVTEAIQLAKKNPKLEIGLHFDVEYGYSFDRKGYLDDLEKDESDKVRDFFKKELLDQITKFEKLFSSLPTHIDGHHHIQRFPAVLNFIQQFSQEKKIPLRDLSGISRIKTFSTGNPEDLTIQNLTNILRNLKEDTFELMTHPAYSSEELKRISSWSKVRELELKVLTDPEIKKVIKEEKIKLISWKDISV